MRISDNTEFGERVGLNAKGNYWWVSHGVLSNVKLTIIPSVPFTLKGRKSEYNGIELYYTSHRVSGWEKHVLHRKTSTQLNTHLDIIDEVLSENKFSQLPIPKIINLSKELNEFWKTAGYENLYGAVTSLMIGMTRTIIH